MPVNVTVEEPWARVVGEEPNRYHISGARANAHDIADNGVDKVVRRVSGASNHVEGVLIRGNKQTSQPEHT